MADAPKKKWYQRGLFKLTAAAGIAGAGIVGSRYAMDTDPQGEKQPAAITDAQEEEAQKAVMAAAENVKLAVGQNDIVTAAHAMGNYSFQELGLTDLSGDMLVLAVHNKNFTPELKKEYLEFLISRGADVNDEEQVTYRMRPPENQLKNPLITAASLDDVESVKLLLPNTNQKDKDSALNWTVMLRAYDAMDYLLKSGQVTQQGKDRAYFKALWIGEELNGKKISDILKENGAAYPANMEDKREQLNETIEKRERENRESEESRKKSKEKSGRSL